MTHLTYPRITKAQALRRLGDELAASGGLRARGVQAALSRLIGVCPAAVSAWADDEDLAEIQAWRLHSIRPAWFETAEAK